MRYRNFPAALKLVINISIIAVFLLVVAIIAIAIYGRVINVDFATAFNNTIAWLGGK